MKISHLFDDPLVKAALEAAERDEGDDAACTSVNPRVPLTGLAPEASSTIELELA